VEKGRESEYFPNALYVYIKREKESEREATLYIAVQSVL
jgi:hypothetical protein